MTTSTTTNTTTQPSHWTRETAARIQASSTNTFPPFNLAKVLPLMPGYHVWDSWFVMTEAGQIASVKGFQVLIALVRPVEDNESANARIAYFYSADGEHYTPGGFLFESKLYDDCQEWSGSTVLRNDGRLQTFYTLAQSVELNGNWQTRQRFATALQTLSSTGGKLIISAPTYHDVLAEPDGVYYETAEQASLRESHYPTAHDRSLGSDQSENSCFRDPHKYVDPHTGKHYLLFEANTATALCPAGSVRRDYIGGEDFEPDYQPTIDDLKANGCVGVLELQDEDCTHGEFLPPWLTANLVTDEIERINIIDHDNHVYLFVVGHGNKNTLVTHYPALSNRDYLLGFRADRFLGPLTPLNDSGVVVQQKSLGAPYQGQEQNTQYVYSWMLIPTHNPDVFDCISYANYSFDTATGQSKAVKTAGPTVQVWLKGLESRVIGMKYTILPVPDSAEKSTRDSTESITTA